jgi:hypothetical protein
MRIHMQDALASLLEQGKGHLATATKAATHPSPTLPDSWSPTPEPPQETFPECDSVLWLRATLQGDKGAAERATAGLHDPQDTIARCEAETKLLDLHRPNRYGYCLTCDPESCGCVGSGDYPCDTIKALLTGYRHREGFKPEWVNG